MAWSAIESSILGACASISFGSGEAILLIFLACMASEFTALGILSVRAFVYLK